MRTNRLLLTLLQLCCAALLSAQTYSGKVVEQDGKSPLAGVNVCLLSNKGIAVSWCITDSKGIYSLSQKVEKPAVKLRFSFVGFKTLEIPLADFPADGKIVMASEFFKLNEVKISASRIQQRQDTLVYSVAGFSQPQDRSIADVIAKMPGMEVGANGQISFNGKNINKFYIEGLDLMNDQYTLASSNISRRRVKSVEVLQNHQPVELLRGKSFSEQAAINLVLEDDNKMNLIGSADIGAGTDKDELLYNNRLLGMLFGKKHQNLSIYKNDNTGYDLYAEINPVTLSDLNKESTLESNLITAVNTNSPDIDRSRYIFNHSHLVATNHLAKLAEKTTLRTQISYFYDKSEQENRIETEYLFADTISPTFENNALKEKRNRLDASLDFELNRSNLYIKNELEGTLDWFSANSSTVWNNRSRQLSSTPDRKFLSNSLDIKLPLSGNRHLSIVSVNSYNEQPQSLSLYSDAVQQLDYNAFRTHTSASFRHRLFHLYANYQVGFKGLFQTLSSTIDGETAIGRQHYEQHMPYGGLGLQYDNNSFRMEANGKVHLLHWRKGSEHSTALSPEGRLFLKYTMSGTSSLSATYRYAEQIPDLRQSFDGNLFTSYRSILNNRLTPKAEETHSISLRYQYSQPIKGIFFSLATFASRARKHTAYGTSYLSDGSVIVRTRQGANYDADTYMVNARLSKSFGQWKSLLVLSGSYIGNKEAQIKASVLQDYDLDTYSAKLSYSARPLSFLSLELESSWQQTRMASPSIASKVNHLKHRLDLTFPITNNFRFGINNALHQSIEADESFWFSDFSAAYTYKRAELRLNVNNIWGKSFYVREFVSSIENNYYRYTLRPREIIAQVSFTF